MPNKDDLLSDPGSRRRECRRQRGFALIIVLWIVTLLALQVGLFNLTIRDAGALAGSELAMARGEALASAGIELAAASLREPDAADSWRADGGLHEVRFGGARIAIRISDEAGRLDINSLDKDVADAILRPYSGSAQALARWLETRGPFLDPAGLAAALGRPPSALQALLPHLTIYGGDGKLNPIVAAREALLLLPGADPALVDRALALRKRGADKADVARALGPLNKWLTERTGPAYRVEVSVHGESVSAIGRAEAVILISKDSAVPYRVLGWRYEPGQSETYQEGDGR